jgi:transposase-like protein
MRGIDLPNNKQIVARLEPVSSPRKYSGGGARPRYRLATIPQGPWRARLLSRDMAQHFLASKFARNLPIHEITTLSNDQLLPLFAQARWSSETEQCCPDCGVIRSHYFLRQRRKWRCKDCGKEFSVTSGTVFHASKLELSEIALAIYNFNNSANGVSASELSRTLGIQYKTAWLLNMRLREAILKSRPDEPMSGTVQVDGGYFGGKRRNANRRGSAIRDERNHAIELKLSAQPTTRQKRLQNVLPGGKANAERRKKRRVIFTVRELSPKSGCGAIKTAVFVALAESEAAAAQVAEKFIAPGTEVMTDECQAYFQFSARYNHRSVQHSKEYRTADGVDDNQAESFFSRMRRAEYGVYHGFRPNYLVDYANEFAWREDVRRIGMRERYLQLLELAMRPQRTRWFAKYYQKVRRKTEILGSAWDAANPGSQG